MTASFDPAPEPDDRPFTSTAPPMPAAARVPYRPRPSRWATLFRWWLGASALTAIAIALCVFAGLAQTDFAPLNIVIHGNDISDGLTVTGIGDGMGALVATGLALLALLLVLLLPLLLLLVLGAVAIALVCGVGVPLIVLALALGVATSPFWLVGLLVWLIVRRHDSQRLAASARMAA